MEKKTLCNELLQGRVFTIYLTSLGSLTLVRVSVSGRAASATATVAGSRARAGLSALSLVDDDGQIADLEFPQLQSLSQRLGVVEVDKNAVPGLGHLEV